MENDQTVFQNPSVSSNPATPPQAQGGQTYYGQEPPVRRGFKKFFLVLFALIIGLGSLVSVVFLLLPNYSREGGSSVGEVKLSYWGLFEDEKVLKPIIDEFEKQNPGIKVQYTKQDTSKYKERVLTRSANGTGPDVFNFHNTWYKELSMILLPLPKDTISLEEFRRNYYPVSQKDLIRNGAIYGIPLQMDTLSLFINSNLFQAAGLSRPVTWNDFINSARLMTVKDESGRIKTAGAALGTYTNVTHAPDILSLLFLQNGVDLKNLTQTQDKGADALLFYTSFTNDNNKVWDETLDPSILAFAKGNLAMFFGYSWDYFTIKEFNPQLLFQIVPAPQLPNQSVNLASYWAGGVSQKSKHQKEALLFLKFLTEKETVEKLYQEEAKTRDFGEPFARIDLMENLKSNTNAFTFLVQAPDAFSSPFLDSSLDNGINQQLNTYLSNAVNSMLNHGDSENTFEAFVQNVSPILNGYFQ